MKAKQMLWMGLAFALGAAPFVAQAQTKPVVLRFVSDFPGPPHPAGMAMKHFGDRLPPARRASTTPARCTPSRRLSRRCARATSR